MVFTPPVPPRDARTNSFSTYRFKGAEPSCLENKPGAIDESCVVEVK